MLANHYNIVNAVFEASIVLLCCDKKLKRKENKVMKHNSIMIITIYNVSDVVCLKMTSDSKFCFHVPSAVYIIYQTLMVCTVQY